MVPALYRPQPLLRWTRALELDNGSSERVGQQLHMLWSGKE